MTARFDGAVPVWGISDLKSNAVGGWEVRGGRRGDGEKRRRRVDGEGRGHAWRLLTPHKRRRPSLACALYFQARRGIYIKPIASFDVPRPIRSLSRLDIFSKAICVCTVTAYTPVFVVFFSLWLLLSCFLGFLPPTSWLPPSCLLPPLVASCLPCYVCGICILCLSVCLPPFLSPSLPPSHRKVRHSGRKRCEGIRNLRHGPESGVRVPQMRLRADASVRRREIQPAHLLHGRQLQS